MFSLGAYPDVSLKQARVDLGEARKLIEQGIHPAQHRHSRKLAESTVRKNTFKAVSQEWLKENRPHWSAYYYNQADRALTRYVYPSIGSAPVKSVTAPMLRDLIKATAKNAPTVAILLRQWCSSIFRYAVLHDLAENDPAAALKGLVKRPRVKHHAPLKQAELPDLLSKLDEYGGYAPTKIAIRMLLFTFVRPGELRGATWNEIDFVNAVWRIPGERMKMDEPHVVPLSRQAIVCLRELHTYTGNRTNLFPNLRNPRKYLSATTINRALERMGYQGRFSAHGFRATASSILNELGYRPDVIEKQLAHAERNKVRASYNQAQYFEERRLMMQAWSDLVSFGDAKVAPIKKRTAT